MNALQQTYRTEMAPRLMQRLELSNPMQVPRIAKITLNMGVGDGVSDRGVVKKAAEDLTLIAGQRAVITHARRSVAAFKLREGFPIGCKVTLRRARMYDFLERLVNVAIPRIRDFRGLDPRSFDGRGNYSIGVTEQIIFPEINYDNIDVIRGLDIAITTTAVDDEQGRALLDEFKFPFKR
ncbi:50S ribosomal protein L5 [Candidatus Foliamicus sp.]